MNEQDKILLSAYLDSDLTDSEKEYVENLLESSSDAKAYLEKLKIIYIENKIFFTNTLQGNSYKETSNFLDELKRENSPKFSIKEFILKRRLVFSNLTSVVAVMTIFLVFQGNNTFDQNELFFDLGDDGYTKEVLKTRGASSTIKSNKSLIGTTILEMIENNSSQGNLIYGSETFAIFLDKKITQQENLDCYSGTVFSEGDSSSLVFCKSKNDYSLILNN